MPPDVIPTALTVDTSIAEQVRNEWAARSLQEITAERDRVENTMRAAVDEGSDALDFERVTSIPGSDASQRQETFVRMHSELAGLEDAQRERATAEQLAEITRRNARSLPARLEDGTPQASVGHEFFNEAGQIDSSGRTSVQLNEVSPMRFMNAVFTTSAGLDPFADQQDRIVLSQQAPTTFLGILPVGATESDSIEYYEETTYTNVVAPVAEGGPAPEVTLENTKRTINVRDIAGILRTSERVLEDTTLTRNYIDARLPFMVATKLEDQALIGDNTGENLNGLLQAPGTLTNVADAVANDDETIKDGWKFLRQAKTNVSMGTSFTMPTHYVLNPVAWDEIVLETGSDGHPILGPMVMAMASGVEERIWGLPVVKCPRIPVGATPVASETFGVIGSFMPMSIQIVYRRGIQVVAGRINDDFRRSIVGLRGKVRAALALYDPPAFSRLRRSA